MNTVLTPRQALILRLTVGLLFGLALGWLIKTMTPPYPQEAQTWVQVAASVLLLGAFILWCGAGAMRRLTLAAWGVVALSLIGLIAWNRLAHDINHDVNPFFLNRSFLIYPFLFIAHELVSSGDQARKWVAPFPLYFDQASKHAVQLVLAGVFTALFWGILWLGAALLGFIGFDWLKHLLQNEYFAFPAIGVAIACGVHLGDVQPRLMQNFRALVLGVLAWLLPVITVIGVIFAVSLCFSGLAPLWKTKAATMTLLGGCIALVLLINAAYQHGDEQQGDAERPVHIVLKWAARLACFLVLVFSVLAAYSLYLRIAQYGLTPERVLAAVGVVIALLFGIGYPIAAVWPKGRWLQVIESINIAMAFVMVAVFLAVLTPVADPLRLSTDSQVARLEIGKVTPDAFDWHALHFESGTYGRDQVIRLGQSGKTAAIRTAALQALAKTEDARNEVSSPAVRPNIAKYKVVYPAGAALPPSFVNGMFPQVMDITPDCQSQESQDVCSVAMLDMNDDGKAEMLLLDYHHLYVFSETAEGWRSQGNKQLEDSQVAAFKAGKVSAQPSTWRDVQIGASVLDIHGNRDESMGPPKPIKADPPDS